MSFRNLLLLSASFASSYACMTSGTTGGTETSASTTSTTTTGSATTSSNSASASSAASTTGGSSSSGGALSTSSSSGGGGSSSSGDGGAAQFDPAFGNNGSLSLQFGVTALEVFSDGKVLLGGVNNLDAGFLVQLAEKGTLDNSFGTGGSVSTGTGGERILPFDFHRNADNTVRFVADRAIMENQVWVRSLLVGTMNAAGAEQTRALVAAPAGLTGHTWDDARYADDGRWVAAGLGWDGAGYKALVAKGASDGTHDSSFGTNGVAQVLNAPADMNVWGAVLQSTGRPVILTSRNGRYWLTGIANNGGVDMQWGTNGEYELLTVPNGQFCIPGGITIDSTDRIIAAITCGPQLDSNASIKVFRVTASGALDNSFGTSGITTISRAGGYARALDVMLDTPERICIVGETGIPAGAVTPASDHTLVTRLLQNGAYDTAVSVDGQMHLPQINIAGGWVDNQNRVLVAGGNGLQRVLWGAP